MRDFIKKKSLSLAVIVVLLGIAVFKIFSGAEVTQLQSQPITGFAILPIINVKFSMDMMIFLSVIAVLFIFLFYEVLKKK